MSKALAKSVRFAKSNYAQVVVKGSINIPKTSKLVC